MKVTAKTNKKAVTELKRRSPKAHIRMKGSKTFIVPRPSIEDLQKQNAVNIFNGKKKDVIFEYIRRNKHFKTFKVGVIIGIKEGKAVKIGWSKCNTKIGDVFSPVEGIRIATSRAIEDYTAPVPKCVQKQVRMFGARCAKYFKNVQRIEFPLNA